MGREDEALRDLVARWQMLTLAVREQITEVARGDKLTRLSQGSRWL
jgi:hypothetical protein